MHNKKAVPATETANKKAQTNNTKIRIACPYEYRLLDQLLRGQTSRKVLDDVIGTTNTPEYVRRLRDRGAAGVGIRMEWVAGNNRDGRRIRWGEYYLLPDDVDRVRDVLGVDHG
ncbi:MAG: hypothetical protein BWK73_35900 [Thiothrix lacustris]|uniref:Uncharacterized protein n=1 Tax=Thiothrix lacustris TaxID=525917 RepID=A0A1Y1QFN6_9GAMM|nr:MAG: hypothetical protein BWK73_35900 [Thiothrix lacustris]